MFYLMFLLFIFSFFIAYIYSKKEAIIKAFERDIF